VTTGNVRLRDGEENTGHCVKWMIRNLQEEVVETGMEFYISEFASDFCYS
jgi:hypothetical protein